MKRCPLSALVAFAGLLFAACGQPPAPVDHYARGKTLLEKGDYEGAIAAFTAALEKNPNLVKALTNRGNAWNFQGKLAEALDDYNRALELAPSLVPPLSNRAYIKVRQGDLHGALADYGRVLELAPENAPALNQHATLRRRLGDLEGALTEYRRAIELNPAKADYYFQRGMTYYLARRWTEALADFRQQCELTAKEEEGLEFTRICIWMIRSRLGETPAADTELEAYVARRKGKSEEWLFALNDFLQGRITDQQLLAAVTSTQPKDEPNTRNEAWFFIGMKRLLAADKPAAGEAFRQSLAIGDDATVIHSFAATELKELDAK